MNNSWSTTTIKIFNKTTFNFIPIIKLNLPKPLAGRINLTKTYSNIANSIAFMKINSKFYYYRKYQLIIFIVRDYTLF